MDPAYDYTVRESDRARRVSLRMHRLDGLEVVVPRGFDRRHIPAVLDTHREWIERSLGRIARERALMEPEPPGGRPTRIELRAVGESWRVTYRPTDADGVRTREKPPRELVLSGRAEDVDTSSESLRRWLRRTARSQLIPWLEHLADERDLPFSSASVRLQKTRWASCSARGTITLNAKNLFLPPELVEHVLLHELCHTVHPNHSSAFHALLRDHDADSDRHRAALRDAWRYVPRWAEGQRQSG